MVSILSLHQVHEPLQSTRTTFSLDGPPTILPPAASADKTLLAAAPLAAEG
jgi:hypothetical protein